MRTLTHLRMQSQARLPQDQREIATTEYCIVRGEEEGDEEEDCIGDLVESKQFPLCVDVSDNALGSGNREFKLASVAVDSAERHDSRGAHLPF